MSFFRESLNNLVDLAAVGSLGKNRNYRDWNDELQMEAENRIAHSDLREGLLFQVFQHEVSTLLIDYCQDGRNRLTTQVVTRFFHSQELSGCLLFRGRLKK